MSAFLFTVLETFLSKATLPVVQRVTTAPVDWSTVRIIVHGPKDTPWYMGATAPNVDYEVPLTPVKRGAQLPA